MTNSSSSTTTTTTTTTSTQQGIDIGAALQILSNHQREHDPRQCQCGSHRRPAVASGGRTLRSPGASSSSSSLETGGQVIDLLAPATTTTTTTTTTIADKSDSEKEKEESKNDNDCNALPSSAQQSTSPPPQQPPLLLFSSELTAQIHQMTLPQQLPLVLQAQRDRVATYRRYDRGLATVLATRNLSQYPTLTADVTATFAVLSNTINAVRESCLLWETKAKNGIQPQQRQRQQQHQKQQLHRLLTQLQTAERDKLQSTAALHLEQLRYANATTVGTNDDDNNSDNDGTFTTTTSTAVLDLMQDSMTSLRQTIGNCVVTINEVMEELQCLRMELQEEEEEEDY